MRVLLTRPLADAERTAAALADRGHAAVLAPVTEIRPTGAPLPAGSFDALAITSRHALAGAAGLDRGLPVFAVGRSTAAAARAAGFRDMRIGTGDADGLATLLRLTLPRPARLLYLAGHDRKAALEQAMAAAGHAVAVVETYRAEPLAAWPAPALAALAAGTLDAALHYSRRGTGLALGLGEAAGLAEAFVALRHLCLSEDCAEPLRVRRAASVTVAARPDEDALLALLDETAP